MKGLLFCVALLGCTPAVAEPLKCAPREQVVARLAEKYTEQQRGLGLAQGSHVVELFVSEGGSWTVLLSFPEGHSCLIAAGENWQFKPALPEGDPA